MNQWSALTARLTLLDFTIVIREKKIAEVVLLWRT